MRKADALKFRPSDKIYHIYRAIYPTDFGADTLELEQLSAQLEKYYGVILERIWSEDLTLGELFSHAQRAEQSRQIG